MRHRVAVGLVSLFAMSAAGGCNCGGNNGTPDEDMGTEEDMTTSEDMGPGEDMTTPDPDMPGPDPDMPSPDMGPDTGGPGEGEIAELREVGQQLVSPLDATPSPNAETVYFVGINDDGVGALFSVPAAGGDATEVASGFVAPLNLVVSLDGTTAYVADAGVEDEQSNPEGGVVWRVTLADGSTTQISETAGYQSRGLDLVDMDGDETLYFSGVDPADGVGGVFRMSTPSGTVTAVAKGTTGTDPSGVAVAANGDVYFADTQAEVGNRSAVRLIRGGQISVLVDDIRVGYPAGLALSQADSHLLLSGLDPTRNSAVVYRVNLADDSIEQISMGIDQNSESAGVHRAHDVDQYAWANADAPNPDGTGGGSVYLLGTTASPLQ